MSEETENHERVDGSLPQMTDIFSDEDVKKIRKKIADALKGNKK